MDFVDWCNVVWDTLLEARRESPEIRVSGITTADLAARLFPIDPPPTHLFLDAVPPDPRTSAIFRALNGLQSCGIIELTSIMKRWKLTSTGRTLRDNLPALWQGICAPEVEDDCLPLLEAVNHLSPQAGDGFVALSMLTRESLLGAAPDATPAAVMAALSDLQEAGLVAYSRQFDHFEAGATYRGLVWETRRGLTLDSQFIDDLVAEWETTSVEFKRELAVDIADTKAEFIRDILGLANAIAMWAALAYRRFRRHDPRVRGTARPRAHPGPPPTDCGHIYRPASGNTLSCDSVSVGERRSARSIAPAGPPPLSRQEGARGEEESNRRSGGLYPAWRAHRPCG